MAAMIVVVTVVGKNTGLHPHWAAMMKWSTNQVAEIFTYSTTVLYDSTVQKGCTVLSKGLKKSADECETVILTMAVVTAMWGGSVNGDACLWVTIV